MVGPNFKLVRDQDQKYKFVSAAVIQNEVETSKGLDFHVIFQSRSMQIVIFIASLIGILVLVPVMISHFSTNTLIGSILHEDINCRISLVESIPEGLVFNGSSPNYLSTYNAWMRMLKQAKHSIKIVSFYWALNDHNQKSAKQGENIFNELLAVLKRGVEVTIVQNIPNDKFPNDDSEVLKQAGAEVLDVDMRKFFGSGVLHAKFWVVDDEMMYVGSANTDWKSLTQVKELGVLVTSCKSLIQDALKIVGVFTYAANNDRLPAVWSREFRTKFNKDRPLNVKLNGTDSTVYLTSSPRELCPSGRTAEIDAILDVIKKAKTFINIAVMDYAPVIFFQTPIRFWPLIDDALRSAAFDRKVEINLLGSIWSQTKSEMLPFLKSLAILHDVNPISVKLFCIPSTGEQKLIPHARVNHNKYMVTDNAAYISNSNWEGTYFVDTAGVSIVVNQSSHSEGQDLHSELLQIFVRDWTSKHSVSIWDVKSTNYTCD